MHLPTGNQESTSAGVQIAPFNRLLNVMSAADHALLTGIVEVDLVHGIDLMLPGQPIVNCWFPVSGIVSIIAMTSSGHQTEVGVVGLDGLVDLATLHGGSHSPHRALVQIPGRAWRVKANVLQAAMHNSRTLNVLLLAYAQTFLVQIAGTALANAQFNIEQRLARWLLMCADRVGPTGIVLTHDALSIMLGVRRAGVTIALHHLEELGTITTRRKGIDVVDRERLLATAGDSYGTPEAEYQCLVGKMELPKKLPPS